MATNESGMGKVVLVAAAIGLGSWFYEAIQPPVARPCGSEGGPPVTATRIRLRDGRHLAYAERGVPKKTARFKIIFCHGFSGTRLDGFGASPVGAETGSQLERLPHIEGQNKNSPPIPDSLTAMDTAATATSTGPPPRRSGIGKRLAVAAALVIGLGSWFYAAIQPPPPRRCGSEGGPPVTATRIRLRDGRHLAYAETGVPKETARYKIIFCHGFSSSRLDGIRASAGIMEELGVYLVSYDRAGYVESDPNPRRSLRSEASDIEQLADALELGSRFYLIGYSLGGHGVWASIKYIPGRIAGAALLAPVINYKWPGFPKNLSEKAYKQQHVGDQWALRIAYYAPWLLHWWMNQSWLPTSTVVEATTHLPNKFDAQIRDFAATNGVLEERRKLATQQGIHESYFRDMMVMFGKWDFDPMDLHSPPFPVHLWQGNEDGLVPVELQRYISHRLSWIEYHELSMTGHYLSVVPGFGDLVLKTLLVQPSA